MIWRLDTKDNEARAGILMLNGNIIPTPVFMPVGTQACVKGLDFNDIHRIHSRLILANTYHLYLRPGDNVIKNMGGLHGFSGFDGSFLTDSGGFQAFSLGGIPSQDGIAFKSHIDGSSHFFTPESVLDIQYNLNSDIMMILDDLVALPNTKQRIIESTKRTIRWAEKSIKYHHYKRETHQNNKIFAIIQGGIDKEARENTAKELVNTTYEDTSFDGFAIGGLAVGEEKNAMYDTIEWTTKFMPQDKPRYLMGVGTPQDLIEGIYRGVDMFDCVMPTRNARNGTIFTRFGRLSIKNANFREDSTPIDEHCGCYTCKNFSKGYLNHLYKANEVLYIRLASLHNLHFYLELMRLAREAIINQSFGAWRKEMLDRLNHASNPA